MRKGQIFRFPVLTDYATAIVVDVIRDTTRRITCVKDEVHEELVINYVCYSQKRLFLLTETFDYKMDSVTVSDGTIHEGKTVSVRRKCKLDHIISDYCVIPDLDQKLLEEYNRIMSKRK